MIFRQPTPVLYAQKEISPICVAYGNDAHLGAAEVVVEEVLEPHPADEEDAPVVALLLRQSELAAGVAVHDLDDAPGREPARDSLRAEVAEDRQRHLRGGPDLVPAGIRDALDVREQAIHVENGGDGHRLLRLRVDEQHRPDPAVGVAAALQGSPLRLETPEEVLQVGERTRRGQRIPVPHRLADSRLRLRVVGEVRQRVALLLPGLVVDVLVPPGEGDRLERDGVDLVDVPDRELEDLADLVVVDAVDDRGHQRDVDAVLVEVLDRAQLDVVEVTDLAVLVVLVPDPVELEVREAQPGLGGLAREILVLGEPDPVGGALDREVADLARVPDGRKEVRRKRRLAAGELDRELAPRLDGRRVVQELLDLVPVELVDVTDLVRVHEAWVAHHVAAVREVDREHRAAPVLDRGSPVLVQAVLGDREVPPGVQGLDPLEEGGVDGHHVLEEAVLGARLPHEDPAVLLDDRRLDLAGAPVHQNLPVGLSGQDFRRALP